MIMACVLGPASKLTTARELGERTGSSTLAEILAVEPATADDLYAALDWPGEQQEALENALARKHGGEGMRMLSDMTSTYFKGHACPLVHREDSPALPPLRRKEKNPKKPLDRRDHS